MSLKFFAASVIVRRRHSHYEVLVEDAEYPDGHKETKLAIGGMQEAIDSGNPARTARREVEEETGLKMRDHVDPRLVHELEVGEHKKFFYLMWRGNFKGSIRRKKIKDGDTTLHPPMWVDLRVLLSHPDTVVRTHRPLLDIVEELLKH